MNNGNVGPGNVNAQDFERSMAETLQFDPESLPNPESKEKGQEQGGAMYLDPSMLGASTVNAMQFGEQKTPELGEVVSEGNVGMKALTEEQVIGTDLNAAKFQKNGVSKEMEQKLDMIKKEKDLYQQSIDFMTTSKESLSTSFADRGYLKGGNK